jgi:hypothetical protein
MTAALACTPVLLLQFLYAFGLLGFKLIACPDMSWALWIQADSMFLHFFGILRFKPKWLPYRYWLTAGAQPTPKVTEILGRVGIIPERPKPPSYFVGERVMPKWKAGTDKE